RQHNRQVVYSPSLRSGLINNKHEMLAWKIEAILETQCEF
ncbi:7015_t:CDS:1, partial [Funneliformis geosporum]